MNNRFLTKTLLATAIMCASFGVQAIPTNLAWPLKNKSVKDTTFFFGVDDSVDLKKGHDSLRCSGKRFKPHVGIDILAKPEEEVYAIDSGKVYVISRRSETWGRGIVIQHSGGWTSTYWHVIPSVTVNSTVKKGDKIGTVFATNHAGDIDHLHLGIAKRTVNEGTNLKGYFECGKTNYDPFVNPYNYLSKGYHIILDDASDSSYHPSTWVESRTKDFYYGSGYKAVNIKKNPDAAARLISKKAIELSKVYDVYVRLTPDPNYTNKAEYSIQVNSKTVKTQTRDQRTMKRGANHLLFPAVSLKKGDKVDILVKNKGTGTYMAVDAYILIPR